MKKELMEIKTERALSILKYLLPKWELTRYMSVTTRNGELMLNMEKLLLAIRKQIRKKDL